MLAHPLLIEGGSAAEFSGVLHQAYGDTHSSAVRHALERLADSVEPACSRPDFDAAQALWPEPQRHIATDETIGLIVETRHHMNLPLIVRQVVESCGISVQVMHGQENRSFVHDSLGALIDQEKVVPTPLAADRLNSSVYNGLFLSRSFWEAALGRGKILVFQTDSMLCKRAAYDLDYFLKYDFIGSRMPARSRLGMAYSCNGGLSLRDWKKTAEVLDRFRPDIWPGGEDDFFTLFMAISGGNVAGTDDCDRFCAQRHFRKGCFGLHKPNFRKPGLAAAILAYEPRAWRLLTPVERRLARG